MASAFSSPIFLGLGGHDMKEKKAPFRRAKVGPYSMVWLAALAGDVGDVKTKVPTRDSQFEHKFFFLALSLDWTWSEWKTWSEE